MSRATCPHCQQQAAPLTKKIITLSLRPFARLSCEQCAGVIQGNRLVLILLVFFGLVLVKTISLFGIALWLVFIVLMPVVLIVYGGFVRLEVPSSKNEGIDWW